MSSVSDTYQIKINARKRGSGSTGQIPFEVYYRLDDYAYNLVDVEFTPDDTFTDYTQYFTINHRNYDSITVRIKNKDDGSNADRSNIFDKIELFLWNSTTNTYSSNILGDPNLILNNEYLNGGTANYNYITGSTGSSPNIENWKLSGSTIAEKGSGAWNTGITNETLILQGRNSSIEQKLNVSRTYNSTTQLVDVQYTNEYTSNRTMPVSPDKFQVIVTARQRINLSNGPIVTRLSYNLDAGPTDQSIGYFLPNHTSGIFTDYSFIFTVTPSTYNSITLKIELDNQGNLSDQSTIIDKIELFMLDSNNNIISNNILGDPEMILQNYHSTNPDNGDGYEYFTGTMGSWYGYGSDRVISEKNSTAFDTGITKETVILQSYYGTVGSIEQKLNKNGSQFTNDYTNAITYPMSYYTRLPQSNLIFNGLTSSYYYGTDITFAIAGGSDTGTAVTYAVSHESFGQIPVVDNKITQDISASRTPYTVVATKLGDINYNDISATEYFTVQKGNQGQFDLSGVRPFYAYGTDIMFDISGGSGTGTAVTYDVSHESFGQIPVVGNTLSQDISATDISYIVTATKSGDTNYNSISATALFTVQKSNQGQFDLSGVRSFYSYGTDIMFDISGGSGTGTAVTYDVSHESFGQIPVDGNTLSQDISATDISYIVTATKSGDTNYNSISATEYFTVQKSDQDQLDLSGVRPFYSYGDTIEFDISGGSGTGAVTYAVEHPTFGSIPVVGDTLSQDISATDISYTVIAFKDGDINYYAAISATDLFIIQKGDQSSFTITNDISYVFVENQTIDITTEGGSIVSDVSITINDENGTQLVNRNVDDYRIIAVKSGNVNYKSIQDSMDIKITKASQNPLIFTSQSQYEYSPNQEIVLIASGGSDNGVITFNVIGEQTNVTKLMNPNTGSYVIEIRKAGSLNYYPTTDTMTITITKATQQNLINETITKTTYNPELVIDLLASGGTINNPNNFTLDGTQITRLIHPNAGTYSIVATKSGNHNYKDISLNFEITVDKSPQDIMTVNPSTVNYELSSNTVQLTISGGSTDSEPNITFTRNSMNIDENYIVEYDRPSVLLIDIDKDGNENYLSLKTQLRFEVVKNMDHLKNTLHIPPRVLLENPYINVFDVIHTYTVNELLEDGYSLRELQTMGVTACAVFNTGKYTILDLKRAGYKIKLCAR